MNGIGRRRGVSPLVAGFVAGVAIALVVGLMTTINLQFGAPWASTHTVTAQVTDADSMSVGSDVRIAGRLVGQVTAVTAAGDHSDVTLHVDGAAWPLPADTTAQVRLATLLGQKYIQLTPGRSAQRLADNATIGLRATTPVVDFDQILDTFDKPTRDALTSLVRTAASAVRGQEGTLQQLLPDLSDLSVHSQVPTRELATRDPELNRILANLGVTADQLNQSREHLAGVIDQLNNVSAALASDQGAALKSYITDTDALNLTTRDVLAGNSAPALGNGLQQVGTLAGYLNQLLATLVPETAIICPPGAACTQPHGHNAVSDGSRTPAEAGIDLIYEIGGSAVSQANASMTHGNFSSANFFLRQYAQAIDDCGLAPCSAPSVAAPSNAHATTQTPVPPPHCIPLVTCPGAPPLPLPTPPALPCVPLVNPCASPTPLIGIGASSSASLAPLPLPSPSLPIGIAYQPTLRDWDGWTSRYVW